MDEIKPFKDQDYELLKSQHSASNLFVDPEFPAVAESLSHTGKAPRENIPLEAIEWKRPTKAFKSPQFVMDGFKRNDLHQGVVSNCWFIAACAAVTLNPDLLERVIPQNQSFDDDDYIGMFHFRFWLYGHWYDVVIDDQLPFHKNKLIYCHNGKDPQEMWPALLEKAYAKVCGSYESMAMGQTTDALIDMTAGLEETFQIFQLEEHGEKLPDFKERIRRLLEQGCAKRSMLGCSITRDPKVQEAPLKNGLRKGHAYSITGVDDVTNNDGETITLVRVRNPWGNKVEWNGPWSDGNELWDNVSDDEKARIKYRKKEDGEFWMSFDDFFSTFHKLNICHRGPSAMEVTPAEADCIEWSDASGGGRTSWKEDVFHGQWIPGQTAGGYWKKGNSKKYFTNPQYLITLTAPDDKVAGYNDDDQGEYCTAIISLMQKHRRARIAKGEQVPTGVAFLVFRVNDDIDVSERIQGEQTKFYMKELKRVQDGCASKKARSVTRRCRLSPGTYVIIPSTLKEDEAAEFLLRVFTEKGVDQTAKAELDHNKENLTEEDVAYTKKDFAFADLLDGVIKLFYDDDDDDDDKDELSPSENPQKQSKDENKSTEKEEFCSIQ